MAKITITLEDHIDADGEMGMNTSLDGVQEAADAAEKGEHSVALLVAMTFYRMMEQEIIQRQLGVWCPREFADMRMAEMKKQAGIEPANDS